MVTSGDGGVPGARGSSKTERAMREVLPFASNTSLWTPIRCTCLLEVFFCLFSGGEALLNGLVAITWLLFNRMYLILTATIRINATAMMSKRPPATAAGMTMDFWDERGSADVDNPARDI